MLQKKAKKRASLLVGLLSISVLAIFLVLKTLDKNILYFKSPTDIKISQDIDFNKKLRVGGMVKRNSIIISEEEIKFIITDSENEIIVSYKGSVPNLFIEEKGVVAEGVLRDKKYFIANRILAKHDENYMPPGLKQISEKDVK